MADYGIILENSRGEILIDSEFQNYSLHQKFSGSWQAGSEKTLTNGTILYLSPKDVFFSQPLRTNEPPIICAAGMGRYVAASIIGSPGNWTGMRLITTLYEGEGRVSYEAYAYCPSRHAAFSQRGSYGLQVFNGAGGLVFDSRKCPLIITSSSVLPVANNETVNREIELGLGVMPDSQLFRGIYSVFSYSQNVDSSDLHRMCAKISGGRTFYSLRKTGYDEGVGVGASFAQDAISLNGDRGYEVSPLNADAIVPYCVIKTPNI